MKFHAFALILRVPVFFAQIFYAFDEKILVGNDRIFAHDLKFAVDDLPFLHAVIADDVDGIFARLRIYSRSVPRAHDNDIVFFFQPIEHRAVFAFKF